MDEICVDYDCCDAEQSWNKIASRIKSRAQIAQLVEQRTENPRVTGSIPVLGIFAGHHFLKWPPCFIYKHAGVVQW